MIGLDLAAASDQGRALDGVSQFADVPRPAARGQLGQGACGQIRRAAVAGRRPQEGPCQERDVFDPLAKRRHVNVKHAEPVEEIFAEFALRNQVAQCPVRGGQHAKIGATGPRVAHGRHFVLLDGPQQFHLHGERHVADFVQEDGAAVGQLEQALPRCSAPVNAPRTCPNSSLSITPALSAARHVGRNGASLRRLCR